MPLVINRKKEEERSERKGDDRLGLLMSLKQARSNWK